MTPQFLCRRRGRRRSGKLWTGPAACLCLGLLVSCEQLGELSKVAGAFAGNLLIAAANNYAPGHAEAVKALVGAFADDDDDSVESPGGPPLALDIALLKETRARGEIVLVPLEDGAVLRDGREDPLKGDRFRIVFRTNEPCFVYVVGIDATGWVTPLFPAWHSTHQNPVTPGLEYQLPDAEYSFSLNEYRGVEHVYFLASHGQRADIEEFLASFREGGETQPAPASSDRVEEQAVVTRGVGDVVDGKEIVLERSGVEHMVTPTSFLSKASENDLVITRWFRHE